MNLRGETQVAKICLDCVMISACTGKVESSFEDASFVELRSLNEKIHDLCYSIILKRLVMFML